MAFHCLRVQWDFGSLNLPMSCRSGGRRRQKRNGFGSHSAAVVILGASKPTAQTNKLKQHGRFAMRKMQFATCLGVMAAFGAGVANANDELKRMSQNPNDWGMQAGDY